MKLHVANRLMLSAWLLWAPPCVLGCDSKGSAKDGERAAEPAKSVREVRVGQSTEMLLTDSLTVTGTLAAEEQVTVSVKVPGRLQSIAVDLGTRVKRGQVVAQIETADYQLRVQQALSGLAQARAMLGLSPEGDDATVDVERTTIVRQAHATLDEARSNLERSRSLLSRKLIAPAEFDAVNASFLRAESALASAREEVYNRQAQLAQRKSELQLAQRQLSDSTLRSPLDGVVAARQASAGEFLSVGMPVATLVQMDPLRLRVDIPERDGASLEVGQVVRIRSESGDEAHEGKVARISPVIDPESRTLAIEAEFANPEGALKPGSFVRAEIAMESPRKAIVVPESALVVFAGIEKVLTIDAGKILEKPVKTGRRFNGFVEIVTGLDASETIVLEPSNLQQGEPVKVVTTLSKER